MLAEIGDEARWFIGVLTMSVLALLRWTAKGQKKMSDYENRLEDTRRIATSAHAKLASVTPRVEGLELKRAEDRAMLEGLATKLDEKAGEIRDDISELRNDLKGLFGGGRKG